VAIEGGVRTWCTTRRRRSPSKHHCCRCGGHQHSISRQHAAAVVRSAPRERVQQRASESRDRDAPGIQGDESTRRPLADHHMLGCALQSRLQSTAIQGDERSGTLHVVDKHIRVRLARQHIPAHRKSIVRIPTLPALQ